MSAQFNKVFNVYDESLNQAHSKSYRLSIQLSPDGFSITILNLLNSKYLSIESSEFHGSGHPEEFIDHFESFSRDHHWLRSNFEQVILMYEPSGSTLIPGPLFDPVDMDDLAKFNFNIPENSTILSDVLVNTDAHLLYSVPESIEKMVNKLFPNHILVSHASVLIDTLMMLNKNLPAGKRLFVNVRNGHLDLVIIEGKNLIFYNSFPYHSKQDFIYYIIFVIEQLNLNPEEIDLKFSGKIDKKSTLFDMAWRYIRNIDFQELPANFRYSYLFNDIPPHYYFTLLNSGVCVS